ncbi:carbohydrate esterase family 4 protein [Jaapia argillacea MUCL 33604]|uniref:Carbohydrate esterase family 4 protein n=1 Tax=Jaapia argillacea MUCL 33604 TaxID=933084 RepID=A0A067PYR2_9AGAM|nr:carbohydrate esterase family 4 protein [Jaapia argillacea MUCL 33604]
MRFTSFAVVCAAVTAVCAAPSLQPTKRQTAAATVYSSCVTPNTVALTFDDGVYIYEKNISDMLVQNQIKGTFFVNGNNWACIYDTDMVANIQNTFAAGHQVAAHTWSHPDLTTLTEDDITSEFEQIETALNKILGIQPAMMRPPYGNYNPTVQSVAAARNQTVIVWDFDDGDSEGATVAASEAAYDAIIAKKPSTIMSLNHETYQTTAQDVLPYAIAALKKAGYTFATVSECLGIPAYQWTTSPGTPDASWTCANSTQPGPGRREVYHRR